MNKKQNNKKEKKSKENKDCIIIKKILIIYFFIFIYSLAIKFLYNKYDFLKSCKFINNILFKNYFLFIIESIIFVLFLLTVFYIYYYNKNEELSDKVINKLNFKDLDEERYHMENLINSRFNFLLVILSAALISLSTIHNRCILFIVIFISIIISSLFSLAIARAHFKFKILMNIRLKYKNYWKKHPAGIADKIANNSCCCLLNKSKKDIIGFYLPLIIVFVLIAIFFAIHFWPDFIFEKVIM